MTSTQIVKWGNSQGVRIPQKLLKAAGIEVNDNVTIVARDRTAPCCSY